MEQGKGEEEMLGYSRVEEEESQASGQRRVAILAWLSLQEETGVVYSEGHTLQAGALTLAGEEGTDWLFASQPTARETAGREEAYWNSCAVWAKWVGD